MLLPIQKLTMLMRHQQLTQSQWLQMQSPLLDVVVGSLQAHQETGEGPVTAGDHPLLVPTTHHTSVRLLGTKWHFCDFDHRSCSVFHRRTARRRSGLERMNPGLDYKMEELECLPPPTLTPTLPLWSSPYTYSVEHPLKVPPAWSVQDQPSDCLWVFWRAPSRWADSRVDVRELLSFTRDGRLETD